MSVETDKALGDMKDQLLRKNGKHKFYVEQQLAEVAARDPEDNNSNSQKA